MVFQGRCVKHTPRRNDAIHAPYNSRAVAVNQQPFRLKSPAWDAKLSPFWVRVTRPYRRHMQRHTQRLLEIDIRKFAEGAAQPRKAAGPLTETLEYHVQKLLDCMPASEPVQP